MPGKDLGVLSEQATPRIHGICLTNAGRNAGLEILDLVHVHGGFSLALGPNLSRAFPAA